MMKKKINYFNAEERNGLYLLSLILFLFSIFIFLQKRVLPSSSQIQVIQNTYVESEGQQIQAATRDNDLKTNLKTQRLRTNNRQFVKSNNTSKNLAYSFQPKDQATFQREVKEIGLIDSTKMNNSKTTKKSVENERVEKTKIPKRYAPKVSINSTIEEEWMSLYGIGPKYAERIVKYQKWLGGFYQKEQLQEVYGISDSLYQSIEIFLIDSKPYKRMLINQLEMKELARHPYIDWKLAKAIIQYRKHHGPFEDAHQLKNMKALDDETYHKILPYLDFSLKEIPESNS